MTTAQAATINNFIQNGFVLTTHSFGKCSKKPAQARQKEIEDRAKGLKPPQYGRFRDTGLALCVNMCKNLVIIDVDVNKQLTAEEKAKIRCSIMREMRELNVLTVISGNGGLHLYTLKSPNLKQLKSRNVKIYKDDKLDIDLFISDESKDVNSLVLLPGSKIADLDSARRPKNERTYRYAEGFDGSTLIDKSCYDVIQTLVDKKILKRQILTTLFKNVDDDDDDPLKNIFSLSTTETPSDKSTHEHVDDSVVDSVETTNEHVDDYNDFLVDESTNEHVNESVETQSNESTNENVDESIPQTLEKTIIEGFKGVYIHKDSEGHKTKDEVTTMVLFQALNAIENEELREWAYEFIKKNAKLTQSARDNWENEKEKHERRATNTHILVKYLKSHNKTYYDEKLKPILEREIVDEGLTFNKFSFYDIQRKIYDKKYETELDLVEDLIKVMRCCDVGIPTWFEKTSDEKIEQLNKSVVNSKLRDETFKGRKLIDIIQEHKKDFITRGIKFYTNEEGYLNLFHGYKYTPNDNEEGMKYVEMWNSFVREVMASNRPELYDYIQQWISYIINVIDGKTETALILRGLQGTGKGTFAHVLIELFSGYVLKNLTDISQATGKFNAIIEGKKLGLFNELKNAGDDRSANFDALKTVITERETTYEQKFVPSRQGENVINLILMTNNAYPVKIEVGDRRYVLIDVNDSRKGDLNYWSELYEAFDNHKDEFYPALMHYYVQNYNKEYNLRNIPHIKEREEFIDATKSDVQIMIEEHFSDFVDGVVIENVKVWKPASINDKSFYAQLNLYCDQERPTIDGHKTRRYKLKSKYAELLKSREDNNDPPDEAVEVSDR